MKLVTYAQKSFLDEVVGSSTSAAFIPPVAGSAIVANQAATVAAIPASTNITTVPGSFADLAAVQTYLATAVPIIESRLDTIESKVNAILTSLKNAGLML